MISTSATAPITSSAIGDQPALGRKIQAVTTAAIRMIPATAGQNNAFQCGCRCMSTCSSLVSTLSGKPTPTSCRDNVRCDGSGRPPIPRSADRLSDMFDIPGGDRGGYAVRAGHDEAAGTVHIGRGTGEGTSVGQRHPYLLTERAAVHTVRLAEGAALGIVAPAAVPGGGGGQQGARGGGGGGGRGPPQGEGGGGGGGGGRGA